MPGRPCPRPPALPARRLGATGLLRWILLVCALFPSAATASPHGPVDEAPICSTAWLRGISEPGLDRAPDLLHLPPLDESAARSPQLDDALAMSAASVPAGVAGIDQSTLPNDFIFLQRYQQNLKSMHAVEAWGVTFGSEDVTVAIVADGVEVAHEDLAAKIWRNPGELPGNGVDDDGNGYVDDVNGWDFGEQDNDPSPIDDPRVARYPVAGTAMAGLIAAQTNNEIGMAGIAWHARILPLKTHRLIEVGDRVGVGGRVDYVTEAICYAANAGARIIVVGGISLNNPSSALQDLLETRQAIQYAWRNKGAVVVAPAGECGQPSPWCPDPESYGENPPTYPASLAPEQIIGVTAYHHRTLEQRANASHGEWVDIAAPGEGFYSAWRDSGYRMIDGTYNTPSDLAAAHVAGVAALMLSANPSYTPEMIEGKLCEFAQRDAGIDFGAAPGKRWPHQDRWGCGRLQAEDVLEGMPWQVRVAPDPISVPIDSGMGQRCAAPLVSHNLNVETFTVATDKPWLSSRFLPQRAGERARLQVCVDVPGLREDHGGRLQSGTVITEQLEVRAHNPQHPMAEARSISDAVVLRMPVALRVWRLFVPFADKRSS